MRTYWSAGICFFILSVISICGLCQDIESPLAVIAEPPKKLTMVQSVMSEGIKEHIPQNPTVIFSVSIGKVFCFTAFDPVPEKTFIYHNWFRMDKLSTKIKLPLNIPSWSTYSSIQLRETDIGPWRVEITDQEGTILGTLRFSITD